MKSVWLQEQSFEFGMGFPIRTDLSCRLDNTNSDAGN